MHDIFEGLANYLMSFLINHFFFNLNLFSLQMFNDRLFGFDFGDDKDSKPCALSLDRLKQGNVKQSASEMLVLTRYFGLLIGDLIPTNEPTWFLYLLFRQILNIIMCRTCSSEQNQLLKTLITEFHTLYLSLTHTTLKPKFHFLLHYPLMAEKFGPLINLWCMRYEAKHRVSKMYARATFNRRTLTKSLAMKHQLQLLKILSSNCMKPVITVGKKHSVPQTVENNICGFLSLDPSECANCLYKVTWANVKGTCYYKKSVLSTGFSDDSEPEFSVVDDIYILDESNIIFYCQHLKNLGFSDHIHAFEVEFTHENSFVLQERLVSYVPNNLNVMSHGKMYVTVRDPL